MEQTPGNPPVPLEYQPGHSADVYRERTPGARRRFVLIADRLVIHHWQWLGSEYEVAVPLASISPEYAVVRKRSQVAGAGSLILAAMFGGLFVFGWFHGRPEFFPFGATLDGLLTIVCLITGLRHIRKIEYYTFATRIGVTSFDIARSGPDRKRFDEFAARIIQTIYAASPSSFPAPPGPGC